jgi:hypothetical protein
MVGNRNGRSTVTATAGVDAPSGADLLRHQMSPESTNPMTSAVLKLKIDRWPSLERGVLL